MTTALYQACGQAVHVLAADGRVLSAGRAVLFILVGIGYPNWLIWPLTSPPLSWVVELGYRLIARHRPFFSRFLFRNDPYA